MSVPRPASSRAPGTGGARDADQRSARPRPAPRAAGGRRGIAPAAALLLAAGCAGDARRAAPHVVEIRAFRYAPDTLTVLAGDTVRWINRDPLPHTATDAGGRWDTGEVRGNASADWVAEGPGTVEYVCAYHPNMRGTIVVRARP